MIQFKLFIKQKIAVELLNV